MLKMRGECYLMYAYSISIIIMIMPIDIRNGCNDMHNK